MSARVLMIEPASVPRYIPSPDCRRPEGNTDTKTFYVFPAPGISCMRDPLCFLRGVSQLKIKLTTCLRSMSTSCTELPYLQRSGTLNGVYGTLVNMLRHCLSMTSGPALNFPNWCERCRNSEKSDLNHKSLPLTLRA
jgi:hypothetical protein